MCAFIQNKVFYNVFVLYSDKNSVFVFKHKYLAQKSLFFISVYLIYILESVLNLNIINKSILFSFCIVFRQFDGAIDASDIRDALALIPDITKFHTKV